MYCLLSSSPVTLMRLHHSVYSMPKTHVLSDGVLLERDPGLITYLVTYLAQYFYL